MAAAVADNPVLLLTRRFEASTSPDDDESSVGTKAQHSRLAQSLLKSSGGDKRRPNAEQRTEFVGKVSEFAFKAGNAVKAKVDIRDLSRPLVGEKKEEGEEDGDKEGGPTKKKKKGVAIHKETRNLKARAPTRAPLEKHRETKLLRKIGYDVAVEEAKKWKGIVKKNREAETISLPLTQPSFNVASTQELVKRFKPRTPLELEVAKLLQGSESVLGHDRVLTVREERALKAMDLEEAKRKRAELQKTRSLQSFAQTRARRQGKIKSKRYHRRTRKEKEAENAKVYAELEKSHPEKFKEMLERVERKRVEERMNQRHKNNSKWVKSMMKLGKKDAEARTALNEALEKNRELTQKRQIDDDEEEEEETTTTKTDAGAKTPEDDSQSDNPWLAAKSRVANEKSEEDSVEMMYPVLKEIRNEIASDDDDDDDVKNDDDHLPEIEDDDEDFLLEKGEAMVEESIAKKTKVSHQNVADVKNSGNNLQVNPDLILGGLDATPIVASSQLPTLASIEDDDDDDDDRRLTIEEAFADDDVVAEFASLKNSVVAEETPKAACSALPGWGDWLGGKLSGVSSKRRRRFTTKPAQQRRRRDARLPRVIVNEAVVAAAEAKMAAHRVSDFPTREFASVEEFEKSIRAPVGRTWNAEAAYQKMITPAVTTKMGTIIDPIDKERTFVRKEEGEEEEKGGKKKRKRKNKTDEGGGNKKAKIMKSK